MRLREIRLMLMIVVTTLPMSSCKNPPQESQCFYRLEVSRDAYEEIGADAIGRIHDRLFDKNFDNGWTPPLIWENALHFAEECELTSEAGTYILTELDAVDYSYSLREIAEADYRLVYNSR